MRCLSFLFAFYFFALAIRPCAELFERDNIVKQRTVKSSNHESNHEDHRNCSTEMCSPFCICNCGGIYLIFIQKINQIVLSIFYPNIKGANNFFFISPILNSYLFEFWQPPRVVND